MVSVVVERGRGASGMVRYQTKFACEVMVPRVCDHSTFFVPSSTCRRKTFLLGALTIYLNTFCSKDFVSRRALRSNSLGRQICVYSFKVYAFWVHLFEDSMFYQTLTVKQRRFLLRSRTKGVAEITLPGANPNKTSL